MGTDKFNGGTEQPKPESVLDNTLRLVDELAAAFENTYGQDEGQILKMRGVLGLAKEELKEVLTAGELDPKTHANASLLINDILNYANTDMEGAVKKLYKILNSEHNE